MSFLGDKNVLQIIIPSVETCDKVTHYNITITLGSYSWKLSQRYSTFSDLHDILVTNHGLARDLLPPKKLIGNKDQTFVEKRRKDLQVYLQSVVSFMSAALPGELAEFLDLKYYELNFLLQDLAKQYYREGVDQLQQNQPIVFNPLQLMAISRQMVNPHPVLFVQGKDSDFANVVDFCSSVKKIIIRGATETYKTSNIIMNELEYDLNVFKTVEELLIYHADTSKIENLGCLRKTVKSLTVNYTNSKEICDILICDSLHRDFDDRNVEHVWCNLENLDVSSNKILSIDKSIILTPKLKYLNASANKLTSVGSFLTRLPQLTYLNLSNNQLQTLENLHTKLGNIKRLDLSQNNISSLEGLSKLYSVVYLNLASNNINNVSQAEIICLLPCLEELILTGNPVATIVDYRTKILELFGKRSCEICLDNERPTQKELDKVAVLQALKAAKEGRLPNLSPTFPLPIHSGNYVLERADVASVSKE